MIALEMAERRFVPDAAIRLGIRRLLARRLRQSRPREGAAREEAVRQTIEALRTGPLAVETDKANAQHYEVPAEFFRLVLGPRLKYSCCLFPDSETTLAEAERAMLELTCRRAELGDGMSILELGCGWGSLTLWMAERFPGSRIVAVSNSHSQRRFIEQRCDELGLTNVRVLTEDVRRFSTRDRFDRVVSVEMFEHVRNHEILLSRIREWLVPGGLLFVHLFCHRDTPYLFEDRHGSDWMSRHFFSGGMMPSDDLLPRLGRGLELQDHARVCGLHYWRTCEAWLGNLDRRSDEAERLLEPIAGPHSARRLVQRWRMFFMACGELFRYRQGREWFVSHYRFRRVEPSRSLRADAAATAHAVNGSGRRD